LFVVTASRTQGGQSEMARRGFIAELQHIAKVSAQEQAREAREAERKHKAAIAEAERTRKADERAALQFARANAAEQKRFAKEAREAHIGAMGAEVERRNLELSRVFHAIDSLLAATLDVDDYVDLEALRTVVEHPSFDRTDLETPVPAPGPVLDPPEPTFTQPSPPRGLRGLLGKKKHERTVAEATSAHEQAVAKWQAKLAKAEAARKAEASRHADLEAKRISELEAERTRYAAECSAREAEADERNQAIDKLIANLGYGTVDAVQEYVSIVLSSSVYPECFSVDHDFAFDAASAELKLRVLVPGPSKVSTTKTYKYTKSSDEITSTELSQKASKERYASAVHQVALRSIHEVFEADRRGIVKTISLEVGTETINPATGREAYILFVATGAERDSFLELNLSNVVPAATLELLGAAVSKNPFGLVAADATGIRQA
jgi:restriction system protein